MAGLVAHISGVEQTLRTLSTLPVGVQRRQMRIALNAGGGVVKPYVERLAPRDTGTLRRSIGVKVKSSKAGNWYAAVGAKSKHGRYAVPNASRGGWRLRGKVSGVSAGPPRSVKRVPTRYAHLAERGTRQHAVTTSKRTLVNVFGQAFGKRVSIRARPRPFLEAAATVALPAARAKATEKIIVGVQEEALKARGRI